MEAMPKGCKPVLMGNLNINLEYSQNDRDVAIAEQVVEMDLTDMTQPARSGRWTWR